MSASCFALALVALAPPQDRVDERRKGTAVMLHRGSADLAVENTLAACEASFLHGADGVEIDIRSTKDGVLVLMHDPWIDRVLDAYGNVSDWSLDELLLTRYRDPYGFTRADERIPTLRETFELCRKYSGLLHLDIKVPGADREIRSLLEEMKLLPNVVRVNPFNDAALRSDERIRQLASQGAIIHGNNDYDPKAVAGSLKRTRKGTFLVDDPRAAVALLGRPVPKDRALRFAPPLRRCKETPEDLLASRDLPRRQALAKLILHYPDVAREKLLPRPGEKDTHDLDRVWAIGRLVERGVEAEDQVKRFLLGSNPSSASDTNKELLFEALGAAEVEDAVGDLVAFVSDRKGPLEGFPEKRNGPLRAARIRARAAALKALGRIGSTKKEVLETLRDAVRNRSYHLDGAWHGLDGAEAVKALAALDPKGSVPVFRDAVLRIDPKLAPITKHEEHPWWLRRTASWWDFRLKTEALRALGQAGTPEAAEALGSFLSLPPEKAKSIWRELYWDSARALCSGRYEHDPRTLRKLFEHHHSSVRRTAAVYLLRSYRAEFRPLLDEFVPWANAWVKQ